MSLYYEDVIDQISRRSWIAGIVAGATAATQANGQANWQPAFLSSAENEALISLGERIIPGSTAAQTNRVIDLVLNIESAGTQAGFREALKTFSDAGFAQLPPAQQDALLTDASTRGNSREHAFLYIKEWLADAYWTSKPGLKELGSEGRMAWRDYAPCPHPAS